MRNLSNMRFLFVVLLALLFATFAIGQDKPATAPVVEEPKPAERGGDLRMDILKQLGLSREQVQQIRRANIERKPLFDAAQTKLREANKALDQAIYADLVNEQDVQARLRDVQLAQADLIRVRFMNELTIRRILTPDQLMRFREIRQRFEEARENFQTRPRPNMQERRLKRQDPNGQTPKVRPDSVPQDDKPNF